MSKVPSQNEPNWPPKSPHQALLSSPSGRKKWEQHRLEQASPSSSPAKRLFGTPKAGSRAPISLADAVDTNMNEDDDEETLQLKLQAIEARLKLKKLQSAKAKQTADLGPEDGRRSGLLSPQSQDVARKDFLRMTGQDKPSVQVPLSPTTDRRAPQNSTSPARVLLGIDKGLRAQDVSLKRPASSRAGGVPIRSGHETRPARAHSYTGFSTAQARGATIERPKSFGERLAESRVRENEKQAKDERIQKARSRGFGLHTKDSLSSQQSSDSDSHSFRKVRQDFQEDSQNKRPITSPSHSFDSYLSLSKPPSRQANASFDSTASWTSNHSKKPSAAEKFRKPAASTDSPRSPDDTSSFDPFSGIHLSKRLLSHSILTRAFTGKEIYHLPRLLQTVKGPEYDPPDVEADYVVTGVIASKSEPRNAKNSRKMTSTGGDDEEQGNSSKFMVLRLTDFKWEIDLFLFDTAFSTFWKLTPGTLIAILNPSIMPPRDRRTGQFSLKLGSSEDTVLEIGTSRDLGFCKSVKKDGEKCGTWIDKRKTEFCEFHVYLQVEKHKRGRMEVNTMTGFGQGPKSRTGPGAGSSFRDHGLQRDNRHYDPFLQETAYIVPSNLTGRTTAERLDADEGALDRGMSREELQRKRWAEKERERELAEKLGRIGGKAGGEYMRLKATRAGSGSRPASSSTTTSFNADPSNTSRRDVPAKGIDVHNPFKQPDAPEPPDAAALGLLGKRATDVTLSPVKRKRTATTSGGGTSTGTIASSGAFTSEPMGWGGAGRRDLLAEGKKIVGNKKADTALAKERQKGIQKFFACGGGSGSVEKEGSPAKKRARLMIEGKGIREPGRDSLSNLTITAQAGVEDDDDELEII